MKDQRTWVTRLQNLSPKIIYIVLAIAIAWPMLQPFKLPLRINSGTTKVFDTVESLAAGSTVLISVDYSAGGAPELQPTLEAFVKHLAKKQVKVIGVSFNADGPMFADQAFRYLEAAGKVYGRDFVNLGYRAGLEGAVALLGQDIKVAFPVDFRGQNTSTLPIMDGLTIKNVAFVFQINNGFGTAEFVRQIQAPFGTKIACAMSQSLAPANLPYLQAGQLMAILPGLRGAAEYESLTGNLGKGSSGMGSQMLGHALVLVLLATGNACYFISKSAGKKPQKKEEK